MMKWSTRFDLYFTDGSWMSLNVSHPPPGSSFKMESRLMRFPNFQIEIYV